jgi:hypothetical protein
LDDPVTKIQGLECKRCHMWKILRVSYFLQSLEYTKKKIKLSCTYISGKEGMGVFSYSL